MAVMSTVNVTCSDDGIFFNSFVAEKFLAVVN